VKPETALAIVLTDAALPVLRDGRCPQCHAPEDQRTASGGFGVVREVCRRCGHEFPLEDRRV
jgi:uncharacterized protein (DUF983 family)